jgi:hypothetical protein
MRRTSKTLPESKQEPPGFMTLSVRDRLRVARAVNRGIAVSDSRLRHAAIERARKQQVVPRRGSTSWFLSWTEVGSFGAVLAAFVIVYLVNHWNVAVTLPVAAALFVAMTLRSRSVSAARRRRARSSETATAHLSEEEAHRERPSSLL